MPKVKLRNVNPIGPTDLPQIGRVGPGHDEDGKPTKAGEGCLNAGEIFEVDAELAGEAPFWRPAEKKDREPDGRILIANRTDDDGNVEVLDSGSGLLALVGIFELAAPAKKADTAAENQKG